MRGRWRVQSAETLPFGTPWLVLRGRERQAVLWNGPVLEVTHGPPEALRRLGPDIMAEPPDLEGALARLRAADQGREAGEAFLDQRLVGGIGNMWRAEAFFAAEISPWRRLRELDDGELRALLAACARLMRMGRRWHEIYRRAGRPCRRCGTLVRSHPQGDNARVAYWCPACQAGTGPAGA
jgi:endonuclease-8